MPDKMAKERNGSVADETRVKNGGASEEEEDGLSKGRASKHDTDSESEYRKHKRKHKSKRQPDDSYADSDSGSETGSQEDDRKRSGKRSRRAKRKPRRPRNRSYDSDSESESDESYSDSESEESEFSDDDSEEERRRRKRRKERRKQREEKERKRRRRDKEKKKRDKDKKKKKKEKKAEKGKVGAVTNSWGKYGIIRDTDMWNKRPEFTAWLAEVKQVNLESLPNWEEKQMFKQFMEDHNTATFPSKKYYNLDAYYQRQMEKEMKKGVRKIVESERIVFNDEEQRRLELRREREKLKEAEVEALKQTMQSGMAQAMKEQAQLREEMAYLYKLGNFEAAAAIQRRLDPDVAL